MAQFTVLYDACVLYPASLRDLLLRLSLTDLYRSKWSDMIHEEWIKGVLRDRKDLTREQLERTKRLMNEHVRYAVVTGFEGLIPSLQLPDPDDRHVLAAAIVGQASTIVTFNLSDFPQVSLEPFGIEAIHPDDFLSSQIDLDIALVCQVVKQHRAALKRPPKTVDEYLATLESLGLVQTVSALRSFAPLL